MQVIVTSKQTIKSKAGQSYVILHGLSESGEVVSTMVTAEQAAGEFAVPESAMASKEQIAALFKDLPVVDIDFNQRGRLVGVKI